jgi:ribosomal-protein-alanine N-acetyltransferase
VKGDILAILKIENASFERPYSRSIFEKLLHNYPYCFLVVEFDNVIIGYTIGIIESDNVGHLISIAVCPSRRREGVGETLTLEVIRILSELGTHKLRLECRESNLPAQKMYEKMGFEFIGTIFQYYGDENARIYIKILK